MKQMSVLATNKAALRWLAIRWSGSSTIHKDDIKHALTAKLHIKTSCGLPIEENGKVLNPWTSMN